MKRSSSRLPLLDYLRFLAALSVVSFHYFWNGIGNGKLTSLDHVDALTVWAQYGYLGVDLFFVISGYVIFMSAARKSLFDFIVGRAVRLYPAYLVAMLTTACFAFAIGSGGTRVTVKQVLGNMLMYYPLHRQPFVDGVYWTLMIEINFYIAVALIIAVGLQKHLQLVAKCWPLLMLAALALGEQGRVMLGGYYAFFACGALFAILRDRFSWFAAGSLLVGMGLAMNFALPGGGSDFSTPGWVVTGAIVAGIFAAFFVVNASAGRITSLPGSDLLGGLTYPLYLVHAHIGYMLLSRYATIEHRALSYALVFLFVLGLAYALHEIVEIRQAAFWKRCFERLLAAPVAFVRRRRRPQAAPPIASVTPTTNDAGGEAAVDQRG